MTAYDVRGQLVAALREFWQSGAGKPLADLDITAEALDQNLADALLPVVSRIAELARLDGCAGALNGAVHLVDDDEAAETLAGLAIQWEAEADDLRARLAPPTEPKEQQP